MSASEGPRWRLLCILLIVAGIFFRLYHADFKLYNPDEVNTSIRISGHTDRDLGAFLDDGKPHRVRELTQFAVPTSQTQPATIVRSLAAEDPQHPPLYFLAMYASERATGDSIFWRRFPAIVFGILAIGAAWWFGWELFGEGGPAWILAALVAVSPFHVALAQEAREYSLYLLLSFLSSALLLSALRTGRALSFAGYAFGVAIGFWSFTLFAFVAAAHAAFLALPASAAERKRRTFASLALAAGALSFVPWLVNLFRHAGRAAEDTSWQASALTAPLYVGKFLFNFGTVFFDLDYLSLALVPVALACIGIAAYSSWIFVRRSSLRVWFLPVAIGTLTLCAVLAPDLIRHETRALQNRYLTSLWFAVEIATAGGVWIALRSAHGARRLFWNAALGGLFVCGILSCGVASFARTWWITGAPDLRVFPAIATRLESLPAPTIVYMEDNAEILLFQPYADADLSFDLHRNLDAAALRSAAHPYAILTSEEASRSSVLPELIRVPVEESFEMHPDPAVDQLRRRGAAARKTAGRLDLALYTTAR